MKESTISNRLKFILEAQMKIRFLLFSVLIIVIGACNTTNKSKVKAIIGSDDRTELISENYLRKVIGGVSQYDSAMCTAFKVDNNEFITARHCVVNESGKPLEGLKFIDVDQNKSYPFQAFTKVLDKADLVYFSVIGLDTDDKLEIVQLNSETETFSVVSSIADSNLSGKVKLVSDAQCKFMGSEKNSGLLLHSCDTVPGSSGSPILFNGKVIGVHLGSLSKIDNAASQANIAVDFKDIHKVNVSRIARTPEGCKCSIRCPGKCSVKNVIPADPLEPFKDAIINNAAKLTSSTLASEARQSGWTTGSCAIVAGGTITATSIAAGTAICSFLTVGAAGCAGFLAASGPAVVVATCAQLCTDRHLSDCQ